MHNRVLRVAVETLAVSILGLGIGLTANAMNPLGLPIAKNHFEHSAATPPTPVARTGDVDDNFVPPPPAAEEMFQKVDHGEVVEMFQSDCYLDERCVFVDARDDNHYEEGHIPGAYQLDHYRIDKYLKAVLPACQNAERVVVYCNGGKCEDSFLAASDLLEEGVEMAKIHVYAGGITAWRSDNLPVECGARHSEDLIYLDE